MIETHGAPDSRVVLLSFDVEPVDGEQSVMDVLDVVYRHDVDATFFVTGEYAARYPHIVKLMTGREVACHGWSHRPFTKMTDAEKRSELRRCRQVLENITGRKVVGFRAPYNRIDAETLSVLEQEHFIYDASIIKGLGSIYPGLRQHRIGEIPVSSILGVPLEDVVFLHYLNMDRAFFYIMKNKETGLESYLFHPHHISQHKKEFEEFINYLKERNTTFISHSRLVRNQHEGVQTWKDSSHNTINPISDGHIPGRM